MTKTGDKHNNIYSVMTVTDFKKDVKRITFFTPSHLNIEEDRYERAKAHLYKVLETFLSSFTNHYMSDNELKLLHHSIKRHIDSMNMYLDHAEILLTWIYIGDMMKIWKTMAIEYELFEGIVNLEKLDEMI